MTHNISSIHAISRDGASTYPSAATDSHPKAVQQASNRSHFIKGLSEAINKYIIREFPSRVEILLAEAISDEMAALYKTADRPLRIRFAHKKRKEGLTVSDIALSLHPSLYAYFASRSLFSALFLHQFHLLQTTSLYFSVSPHPFFHI